MSAPPRDPGDEPPSDASEHTASATASKPVPRPLIRPALRPPGTSSAPRPALNPAAGGIAPSSQLQQLPITPTVDEGEGPSFNHTVRGFTRAQIEQPVAPTPPAPEPDAAIAVAVSPAPATHPPPPLSSPTPAPLAEPLAAPVALGGGLGGLGLDPRQREIRRGPDLQPLHAPSSPALTVTVMRPNASSILPTVSLTALVLLFSAIVLPTAGGPPWELLARPAEVTLQALAAFILIGVVHLLPIHERTRATLGVLVGAILIGFVFVAWRVATTRGAFDAQPALDALFASPLPNAALPGLLALVLLPAALFARGRSARWSAWILGGLGLVAALATLLWMSPSALFTSLGEATFLGDRIGAFATLPLLVVVLVAGVALAPRLRRFATGLGFALWALALVPLAVFALFAAKSDQWLQVLEPLKLVIFLGAIALYAAAAVGTLAADRAAHRPH